MAPIDVAIVGGGVIGLATAHRLQRARPDLSVTVLEAEAEVGTQQSSRNSGVLHAGLYYAPGSAKARWCTAGKQEMERFCEEQGVPVERNGKVVVAVDHTELVGLRRLADRARTNGVRIRELNANEVRELEPHVRGVAGIHSPDTAVTDFGAVARRLAGLVAEDGGQVRTGARVTGLDDRSDGVRLTTTAGDLEARAVVTCAGLQADRIARMTGAEVPERVVPFRGSWLVLRDEVSHLVRGNIYPVPVGGGLPFLGVHLTRRIDGSVWIGPNAVLMGSRHGRGPWSLDPRDLGETLSFGGFWRLAARHATTGLGEVWRDRNLHAMLREVRRYVPGISIDDVSRGPWGVRAQLVGADGQLVDDFTLRASGRVLHVLNAPSPAATASLAIAAELRDRVLGRL